MSSIKNVIYVTIIILVIMTIVMNKYVRNKINKVLNKNIKKINVYVKDIIVALLIVGVVLYMVSLIVKIKDNVEFFLTPKAKQEHIIEESNEKIIEQNKKYREIMNEQTNIENCKNPYIPDGFSYLEGEWNNGFVIEDEKQNQFVWVPCTNIENNENIPILKKKNFSSNAFISYFQCYESDDNYEKFLESAIQNGGFYVSRYEIGIENENPVSKYGVTIWKLNLYNEAKDLSNNMYSNINSSLINGYAYDTMLSFAYDEIKDEKEYIKGKEKTGTKSYKKIYDILDDNFEWTSEFSYDSVIYRGNIFSKELFDLNYLDNRFSSSLDSSTVKKGFRIMIYK